MMTEQQIESMLVVLNRIAVALEASAATPPPSRKRASSTAKKTADPGEGLMELQDASVALLSKEFPNQWGYFKAKIGGTLDRTQNWFSTKDPEFGELLEVAAESGALVNVTFTVTVNGQYTNRHIKTLVYAGGEAPASMAAAPLDDEDVPF